MLVMNSRMLILYNQIVPNNVELHGELLEMARSGFVGVEGCYFIGKCLSYVTNVVRNDFPDRTGYECFINSINIDDYVIDKYLDYGLCFVREVFANWRGTGFKENLNAILSMDEFGLKIKFHVVRVNESWLASDLEDYEESVMVVNSSDLNCL